MACKAHFFTFSAFFARPHFRNVISFPKLRKMGQLCINSLVLIKIIEKKRKITFLRCLLGAGDWGR